MKFSIWLVIGIIVGAILIRLFRRPFYRFIDWLSMEWFCFRWGPVHDFSSGIRKEIGKVGEEMVKLGENMIDSADGENTKED